MATLKSGIAILFKQKVSQQGIFGILSKTRQQRKISDLVILENAIKDYDMIKGLKRKLSDEMLKEFLRRLSYRNIPKGEYVYRKGDKEDNYYILLMGSVGIEKIKKNVPYVSKELKVGDKFGDLSLSENYENRRTSAIALEEAHLGSLDKESYLFITSSIRAQIMKQAELLVYNSLFESEWSKYDLMRVAVNFNVHNFKRDTMLYKEGDPCEMVYFIRSGEVESYIKMHDSEKEFHEVVQEDFDSQNPRKLKKTTISLWSDLCLFGYDEFHQTHLVGSSNLENGINGLSIKRKTNAVVNSHTAEIWTMDVHNFFDFIREKDSKVEELKSYMNLKIQRRDETFTNAMRLSHTRLSPSPPESTVSNNLRSSIPKMMEFKGSQLLNKTFFPQLHRASSPEPARPEQRKTSSDRQSSLNESIRLDNSYQHNTNLPILAELPKNAKDLKNLTNLDYIQHQNRAISVKRKLNNRLYTKNENKDKPQPLFTKEDQEISYSNLLYTFYPHRKPYTPSSEKTRQATPSYMNPNQTFYTNNSPLAMTKFQTDDSKLRTSTRWMSPLEERSRAHSNPMILSASLRIQSKIRSKKEESDKMESTDVTRLKSDNSEAHLPALNKSAELRLPDFYEFSTPVTQATNHRIDTENSDFASSVRRRKNSFFSPSSNSQESNWEEGLPIHSWHAKIEEFHSRNSKRNIQRITRERLKNFRFSRADPTG